MQIGIDARFYGSIGKGLGRYTQKLIENLEQIDAENQYFVFLRRENFAEYQPQNPNFQKVLADYRWYSFSEQLGFPRLLHKYKLDLMHFPHFNVPLLYRKKFVITIHDLILLHFPTLKNTTLNPLWYWIKFRAYRLTIFSAIKRSSKVITISEFTKNDILQNYKIAEDKIKVTYEACDQYCQKSSKKDAEVLGNCGIIKPYILYVGNAYPHKNLKQLVDAFALVQKEKKDLNLVLIGKHDHFYLELIDYIKEKNISNIILPGFVSDCELTAIYKNAAAFVFPSLYEGFGLPPLEAMQVGAPVVSSDHACMREILGESAYFMNASSVNDMAEKIIAFLNDEVLHKELIEKGYRQIKKYSWERMAQETLSVYKINS